MLKHQKGARIRNFAPVAVELCKKFNRDRPGQHRLAMVEALQSMCVLLKVHWSEWGRSEAQKFAAATDKMLNHYSWLANKALSDGLKLWSMVQKHHLLIHLASQTERLHPCTFWCYGSESFMSIAVHMAASCTRGTAADKVAKKVLDKFRIVFHLFLAGHMSLSEEIEDV